MLQELSIRNFAIIEDLNIRFESGLTILSGETGAGKSIIINAVNLLLGSRVSPGLIRSGAQTAELEAQFVISRESLTAKTMAELGYDAGKGLLVRRIISRKDRHRIYINGRLATGQILSAITANLASISGQHAHQGLLKEEQHLTILDQYGDLLSLREAYAACYDKLLPMIEEEQQLLRRQARSGEQMALLSFQRDEIEAATITEGEDASLEKERLRLKNGQFLHQTVQQSIDQLYADQGAVVEQLGLLGKQLAKAAQIDDRLLPRAQEVEALQYGIEDSVASLRDYLGGLEGDPRQLETIEERIDLLNRLKRKYGGTLEDVLQFARDAARAIEAIASLDTTLDSLRRALQDGHFELCRIGERLSQERSQAARKLAKQVEAELAALKMPSTQFTVQLTPLRAGSDASVYQLHDGNLLGETGMDRATFMMAPNVGEVAKPLASIASGGELSRVVLALKAILAGSDALETLVFDEVDAGIGGSVAEVVGKKLALLARRHQILCITHLPQIAKFGTHHFRILKAVSRGRTRTSITPLTPEERVSEIARMLGGERITPITLDHAKEMLSTT
jgi:DNA repair protein RecN (Recombination protein N)